MVGEFGGRLKKVVAPPSVAATCGFGANREMVRRFIPGFGESPVYRSHAPSGADGSGIRWGMALGAAVGSMTAFQGYGALAEPEAILMNYNVIMSGGVQLNAKGERFCDLRVDQAMEVGAGVLATACPYCISNFEDSKLTLDVVEDIEIRDITEIVYEALGGE